MRYDPGIITACAVSIEKSINLALKYDPATRRKLGELDGCIVHWQCLGPELDLYLTVMDELITLKTSGDYDADIKISGKLDDFLRALTSSPISFANTDVHVSGKVHILSRLKTLFSDLEVDWEEPLGRIFGVVPAHLLATKIRDAQKWLLRQKASIDDNISDYLSEELRTIPTTAEAKQFNQDVDKLNAAVQRVEARVQKLLRAPIDSSNH